ncbi:hypothetical protein V1281_003230 [Nitrobacteraceae bacterium AZCC 2161]
MATTTPNGGWPDATNTGLPPGVTLTPSGNLVITQAGTVISGLNITGTVTIEAPNVTLENCKITSGGFFLVNIKQGVTGAVVQNCEINGLGTSGSDGSCGINGQGTFLNNNIYNVENGINLTGSSVIQGNYIHGLSSGGAPHYDGIQIEGGVSNITIQHNTVINDKGQVSAIMIDNDYGAVSNIKVDNNLLSGGDFTVYDDAHFNSSSITGVSFTNNHMGAGTYGVTDFNGTNPTYTGNVNDAATLIGTLNTSANTGSGTTTPPPTTPPAPNAPVISSYSQDSGVVGDGITNHNTLTLTGTAVANSTVTVFDGATKIGTATANSSGAWNYTSAVLADGKHSFTATDTSSGTTGTASSALSVTVDTHAPAAPVLVSDSVVNTNHVLLSGTAEANSTVTVYDGTTAVGTGTAGSNGAWSVTTSALASGAQALTATATDAAGNKSALSQALDPVIGSPAPAPAPSAPKIVSFSTDSGVAGDHITDDGTLTLAGTAVANSTVTVFDGTTKLGTATANSSGAWNYTTAALADGSHKFTATDTSSGATSAASSALSVTVDTVAPAAPVLSKDSIVNTNQVLLTGTAEANSTVKVFDGTTVVGTATTDANGAWTVTSTSLKSGSHNLTATAIDVAGNTSVMSKPLDPVIGSTPNVPTIASFSNDTGKKGDGITSDHTLTLTGTALANSTVTVFDGTTKLGTATANSSGAWNYTTAALNDGSHSLTATDTSSGLTSSASSALAVTIDTHAPTAPTIGAFSPNTSNPVGTVTGSDHLTLSGTAEANSSINIFDGGKQIGSATTNGSGIWKYDTGTLTDGAHSFMSKAVDAAGNTSAASASLTETVNSHAGTSAVTFTSLYQGWNDTVTFKGTADAYSQVKIYDGNNSGSLGSVKAGADGMWSFKTASAVSDTVHNFTAKVTDGGVTTSSSAVFGTTGNDSLKSSSGNDLLSGHGGQDTFVFAPNFGKDVINDFQASGRSHDVVQFSKSVFDNFADVLSHASQVGQDVVIADHQSDTLTLKNVKLAALDQRDFHFA